ncbi:MAG: hypothetical protein RIB98_15970, partial [Acidimicrobiales bacterium]
AVAASLVSRGLVETAVYCGEVATVTVLGVDHRDVWGCETPNRYISETSSEFDLGTRYSSFVGFVAVSDSSAGATVTRVELAVGGVEVFSGDLSVGDQVPLEFDVTGEVRLTMATERLEGDVPALVVLTGDVGP